MRKLMVFNQVSLDGFISDINGDMSWAKEGNDEEFNSFTSENARGKSEMIFGRVTYDLMSSFWPTPMAMEMMPVVAASMNNAPKVVFSRTMKEASWVNTRVVNTDPVTEVRKMKEASGPLILLMGSALIVSELANANLIDEYQLILNPMAIGNGKSMFSELRERLNLTLVKSRTFKNGKLFLSYQSSQRN